VPNVLDYIAWRGDLSLAASPWNQVDSLLLACLAYAELDVAQAAPLPLSQLGNAAAAQTVTRWQSIPTAMAATVRFGEIRLCDFVNVVDAEREMQFAAVTALLPDGTAAVSFRGTDNTLVGWRENFNMTYESPVPAQLEAATYLEGAALRHGGALRLVGHSKGGCLASYAAAMASPEVQRRLMEVCSFDGPGLDDGTMASAGYEAIRPVLRSVVPQGSVVGLLLNHHQDYEVIRADAAGLLQHDPMTWQVLGTGLIPAEKVDAASLLMDETLHEWLKGSTTEQRRSFVDTLFALLDATKAQTLAQLGEDKLRTAAAMVMAAYGLDRETRRMFLRLLGRFVQLGAANAWEMLLDDPRAFLPDAMTKEERA